MRGRSALAQPNKFNCTSIAFLKTQCNHREILDFRSQYFPKELSDIIAALPDPCADWSLTAWGKAIKLAIYTLQSPLRRQQKQMKENNRNLLKMFAWIGFSSSILWIGLILVSIYLYGPSDLQNIPDLVLGFSNRRDLVMNILFYSFWLGVIYWPARLVIARNQPLLPWRI